MQKQPFLSRHPNATSVIGVVAWFATLVLLSFLSGCKTGNHLVEIIRTDTIHVYHTDTIHSTHTDTIIVTQTTVLHDSIVQSTTITNVINEAGELIHSSKETNKESWHDNTTSAKYIQHTVDSLIHAAKDSLLRTSHTNSSTIISPQKTWFERFFGGIRDILAIIGMLSIVVIVLWLIRKFHVPP